ncbi:hypothetical protein B0H12DRAFT_1120397 [Mycena haematopus]|nr:hypothetical protein B0H12DRAFT_1120397 [Mycena haematopus]
MHGTSRASSKLACCNCLLGRGRQQDPERWQRRVHDYPKRGWGVSMPHLDSRPAGLLHCMIAVPVRYQILPSAGVAPIQVCTNPGIPDVAGSLPYIGGSNTPPALITRVSIKFSPYIDPSRANSFLLLPPPCDQSPNRERVRLQIWSTYGALASEETYDASKSIIMMYMP